MSQVPRYGGFQTAGFGTVVTSLPVGISQTKGAGNLIEVKIPAPATYLSSIEVQVSSISSATQVTVAVFRDAAGDEPLIGDGPSEATQDLTIGRTTSSDGGCAWTVDSDVHALPAGAAGSASAGSVVHRPGVEFSVGPNQNDQSIYFGFHTDAGSCNVTRLVANWRA
tara:strand:+ start:370 stop:870 length:501 start_codon:yes stop_codon:yes gene_type:complete